MVIQSTRLFLPLTSQAFEWYNLNKNVEVRKFKGRFKNILERKYQFVELRKGYSGASIFAPITEIVVFENCDALFDKIAYKRVVPVATSRMEAEKLVYDYVGSEPLLAILLAIHS